MEGASPLAQYGVFPGLKAGARALASPALETARQRSGPHQPVLVDNEISPDFLLFHDCFA